MQTNAVPVLKREALSIEDVQKAAGIGRTTIYGLINDGSLPAKKIGKRTVILIDDLKRYLAGLPRLVTAGRS